MKNVGVQWIDPIPNHWEVRKIGQMYKERRTKVSDIDYPPLSVTMKGIVPQLATAAKTDAHDDRKLVKKGDFAINSRSDRRGSCGIAQQDGSVSLINTVLCPKKETNPEYLNWLFHTSFFADEFYRWGHGIVDDLWTTNWSDMKRIVIPFPSLAEQSRIATFLDDRCSKIDEAIARHDALIKKLDEYRKAVITEAVTKGVRGKREMKESGVVWIKEIPSDWTYKPLKAIFTFGKGLSITKANLVEKGFPVISYGQVHAKYNSGVSVCDELIRYVSKDDICESSLVKKNDLIFADTSEDLEGCGNCVYVDTDYPIYGGYHTIVLNSRFEQSNKFIAYLVKTDDWRFQLRRQLTEVKLYSVSQKVLKDTTVILPPLTEQQEIVAYLDEKCAAIDAAKERHAQLMAKLEEYKKSLIYYAVTGKIEC